MNTKAINCFYWVMSLVILVGIWHLIIHVIFPDISEADAGGIAFCLLFGTAFYFVAVFTLWCKFDYKIGRWSSWAYRELLPTE